MPDGEVVGLVAVDVAIALLSDDALVVGHGVLRDGVDVRVEQAGKAIGDVVDALLGLHVVALLLLEARQEGEPRALGILVLLLLGLDLLLESVELVHRQLDLLLDILELACGSVRMVGALRVELPCRHLPGPGTHVGALEPGDAASDGLCSLDLADRLELLLHVEERVDLLGALVDLAIVHGPIVLLDVPLQLHAQSL
eukprot:7677623-Alexandrium_andersonii.AAC.1